MPSIPHICDNAAVQEAFAAFAAALDAAGIEWSANWTLSSGAPCDLTVTVGMPCQQPPTLVPATTALAPAISGSNASLPLYRPVAYRPAALDRPIAIPRTRQRQPAKGTNGSPNRVSPAPSMVGIACGTKRVLEDTTGQPDDDSQERQAKRRVTSSPSANNDCYIVRVTAPMQAGKRPPDQHVACAFAMSVADLKE
ncbi:hypothetical protein BC831DRAFT_456454 [Entophlyctis helioformis]|nr:hypothetical protein BC831DRAFT_456454 [Entophlyctis helioformis]